MSARYAVVVRTVLDPAQALARVLDPELHASVVPLTTLRGRDRRGPLRLGEQFTMRTALGLLRMDDTMVVDRLRVAAVEGAGVTEDGRSGSAGGAVRFVKTGRVLRGVVLARVGDDARPDDPPPRGAHGRAGANDARLQGAIVRWDAELAVRGVPRLLDPVVAVVARLAYGAALRRLLRVRSVPRA
ncbi:hypothetical protein [Georgenia sp. Z1491]|uniref:hypothetical protein n=1 Tax=Georgenia sp. Z1491 TaxID=3416707 RepID=UPI003CEA38EC